MTEKQSVGRNNEPAVGSGRSREDGNWHKAKGLALLKGRERRKDKERGREREGEKEFSICWFTTQILHYNMGWASLKQESGIQVWVSHLSRRNMSP